MPCDMEPSTYRVNASDMEMKVYFGVEYTCRTLHGQENQ